MKDLQKTFDNVALFKVVGQLLTFVLQALSLCFLMVVDPQA
jgi:hypothetical protein